MVGDNEKDPWPDDAVDPGDIEVDTDHIVRHPPDVDIDKYIENCNFRIERLGADGMWVAALTHDDDEPDHHFDIYVNDSGGLHVTHRAEPDLAAEEDDPFDEHRGAADSDAADEIRDMGRVRWSQRLWICPECEGVLEPLGDLDRNERRNQADWWEAPREWADVPAVACYDCERRFRARFEVIDGDEGDE